LPLCKLDAASRIWDGGGTDANWTTAGNWDGNATVANGDNLTFATTLASGTIISLNGNRTANSITIDSTSAFTIANNTLTLTSGVITRLASSSGNQTISSAITLGGYGVWDINGFGSLTLSGGVDDGGKTYSITKNGDGNLILSGINRYDGGTIVNAGTLTLIGTFSNSTSQATLNGGSLVLDYSVNATNKLQELLTFGGGSLTMTGGTSGYIESVTSTAVSAGATTLTRSSGNTVLRLNGISRSAGATLNFASSAISDTDTTNTYGILGGWATVGGSDWAQNSTGGGNGSITAYTGYTSSTAGTTVPGATANVNFQASNTNTWNTQTINSLRFNTASPLTLSITSGQTLTLTSGGILMTSATGGTNQSITGGTLRGASGKDLIVTQNGGGNLTISSVVADNTSATALTKSGSGRLVLSAANTFTGQTFVNDGTLRISANNNLGAAGTGATLNLNGGTLEAIATFGLYNSTAETNNRAVVIARKGGTIAVTGSNTLTIAGVISGAGSLGKTDTGTLTLSGASTYTGGTTVSAGTLLVNNTTGSGTGTGSVTVASGAILGGTGTISGATSIQSGGIQAAGNGIGVQTFSNNLTYQDGSVFSWEIDRTQTQTRGVGYDAVNVTGNLAGLDGSDAGTSLDAVFRVVIGDSDFSNSFWDSNRTWTNIFTSNGTAVITSWASIFSGGFQFYNTSGMALGNPTSQGSFSLSGNTLGWTAFTAVPEPSSALAGLLIAAGLMRRRRSPSGQ